MGRTPRRQPSVDPSSLTGVVASNVKRIRELRSWSQDQLAQVLRAGGLSWTAASIAALETNRRRIDLEEFVLLKEALHTDYENLLRTGTAYVRVGKAEIDARFLYTLFDEDESSEGFLETPGELEDQKLLAELSRSAKRIGLASWREDGPGQKKVPLLWVALRGTRQEAERQLARSMGIELTDLAVLSVKLWGRTLTDERDARLGLLDEDEKRSSMERRRGHITRKLRSEIQDLARSLGIQPKTKTTRKGRK